MRRGGGLSNWVRISLRTLGTLRCACKGRSAGGQRHTHVNGSSSDEECEHAMMWRRSILEAFCEERKKHYEDWNMWAKNRMKDTQCGRITGGVSSDRVQVELLESCSPR